MGRNDNLFFHSTPSKVTYSTLLGKSKSTCESKLKETFFTAMCTLAPGHTFQHRGCFRAKRLSTRWHKGRKLYSQLQFHSECVALQSSHMHCLCSKTDGSPEPIHSRTITSTGKSISKSFWHAKTRFQELRFGGSSITDPTVLS